MAYGDVDLKTGAGAKTYTTNIAYSATVANGTADAGKAVTIGAAGAILPTAAGQRVLGKLRSVSHDGTATVERSGALEFTYTGVTSAELGKPIVTSATVGEVRSAASATAAELLVATGCIVAIPAANTVIVEMDGSVKGH